MFCCVGLCCAVFCPVVLCCAALCCRWWCVAFSCVVLRSVALWCLVRRCVLCCGVALCSVLTAGSRHAVLCCHWWRVVFCSAVGLFSLLCCVVLRCALLGCVLPGGQGCFFYYKKYDFEIWVKLHVTDPPVSPRRQRVGRAARPPALLWGNPRAEGTVCRQLSRKASGVLRSLSRGRISFGSMCAKSLS